MSKETLCNKTFEQMRVGDRAQLQRTLNEHDIDLFAAVSGDLNPTHLDRGFAHSRGNRSQTGYSLWTGALISSLLGNELPGPGTVYRRQELRFHRPVYLCDTVTVSVEVKALDAAESVVVLDCECVNQDGELVATGVAEVMAPAERIVTERPDMPNVMVTTNDGYDQLLKRCEPLEPVRTAVVHPCDSTSLTGAIQAAEKALIEPILVGPGAKIRQIAEQNELDLSAFRLLDVEHSHAAAARAVELVRAGEADVLMKGSLHTDELMGAVVPSATGIRTERRISHVFVMDVPTYHKVLLITDAAVNIFPDLEAKKDICQNAIELAHTLDIETPRVAILSAVETVNPKIPSTLEASALCKMADRGQITGAILDGPLAFDNAISKQAAITKHIESEVAGNADILLVPDLEAGNILAKQLAFLNHADGAGIVLGARVPIILTSRADNVRTRMASCAVAALHAHARTRGLNP